jgi:hypothetical protein
VRTLAFSLWPGYGGCGPLPSGVCWEGVIQEDGQDDGDMNALLRHAGFDAVLCVDPLPGIVGDIERRLAHTAIARFRSRGGALIGMGQQDWIRAEAARPEAGAFRAAAASLERIRRLGEPPAAVAFLDPAAAAVVHSRAVPASAVLAAPAGSALRRPAPLADIQAACSQGGMACPPRSRATVRHG